MKVKSDLGGDLEVVIFRGPFLFRALTFAMKKKRDEKNKINQPHEIACPVKRVFTLWFSLNSSAAPL